MRGEAFKAYIEVPREERMNFEKVKEAMLAAFSQNRDTAYDKFINRVIRRGETVDGYLSDLRQLANMAGMTQESLISAFIKGLPREVRAILYSFKAVQPMTLQ